MYRKRNCEQMTLEDANNRWAKMAKIIPWDMVEEEYVKTFKSDSTDRRSPIPSRIAFCLLYMKEHEGFLKRRTFEHIAENAYMQYFLGLTEFNPKSLFESSMMPYFAKRFSIESMERIDEDI